VARGSAGGVGDLEHSDVVDDEPAAGERDAHTAISGDEAIAGEGLEELAAVGYGVGGGRGGRWAAEERFGRGVEGPGCGLVGPVEERLRRGVMGEDRKRQVEEPAGVLGCVAGPLDEVTADAAAKRVEDHGGASDEAMIGGHDTERSVGP
jgi:hypothetical protein